MCISLAFDMNPVQKSLLDSMLQSLFSFSFLGLKHVKGILLFGPPGKFDLDQSLLLVKISFLL